MKMKKVINENSPWNIKDGEKALSLYKQGKSFEEIAQIMDRRVEDVRNMEFHYDVIIKEK